METWELYWNERTRKMRVKNAINSGGIEYGLSRVTTPKYTFGGEISDPQRLLVSQGCALRLCELRRQRQAARADERFSPVRRSQ